LDGARLRGRDASGLPSVRCQPGRRALHQEVPGSLCGNAAASGPRPRNPAVAPAANRDEIKAEVRKPKTTAGTLGTKSPNQGWGPPSLSAAVPGGWGDSLLGAARV